MVMFFKSSNDWGKGMSTLQIQRHFRAHINSLESVQKWDIIIQRDKHAYDRPGSSCGADFASKYRAKVERTAMTGRNQNEAIRQRLPKRKYARFLCYVLLG